MFRMSINLDTDIVVEDDNGYKVKGEYFFQDSTNRLTRSTGKTPCR